MLLLAFAVDSAEGNDRGVLERSALVTTRAVSATSRFCWCVRKECLPFVLGVPFALFLYGEYVYSLLSIAITYFSRFICFSIGLRWLVLRFVYLYLFFLHHLALLFLSLGIRFR